MPSSSPPPEQPSAAQLAHYLEQRGDLSKPWLLQMLRLAKLKETKQELAPEEYLERLQEAHADLMRLGAFWKGREQEVFSGAYSPSALLEPLPGSPEDR